MLRYLRRLSRAIIAVSFDDPSVPAHEADATAEISDFLAEFAKLHPFAPNDQTTGYREMCEH